MTQAMLVAAIAPTAMGLHNGIRSVRLIGSRVPALNGLPHTNERMNRMWKVTKQAAASIPDTNAVALSDVLLSTPGTILENVHVAVH